MSVPDDAREPFVGDPLADHLNMELAELRPGYARAEMEAAEELGSTQGYLQGGAITCLAEYALNAASSSRGGSAVLLSINLTFLGRVRIGTHVAAEAEEQKLGRRTGLYQLTVTSQGGDLVASGQAIVYLQEQRGATPAS